MKMKDRIWSPEKYRMKNSCNKKILQLNKKKLYDKNISF